MSVSRADIIKVLESVYPFHRREERVIDEVINYCDVVDFDEGDLIYAEGGEAESLFIVQSGIVELRRRGGLYEEKAKVRLTPGDFLGYEIFEPNGVYRASAFATEPATVLIFDRHRLNEAIERNPWLRTGFRMMYESFILARRVNLDWVGTDEVIYFISRRHITWLFLNLIIPGGALIFLLLALAAILLIVPQNLGLVLGSSGGVLLSLLACGWVYLDWTNDYSIITNQRVVFQEKVVLLYSSRQEAPMNAVLKVDTATDLLGRWFQYGNVIASTYAGLVILQRLNHPEDAAALLMAESERAYQQRRQMERRELESLVRERLTPRQVKNGLPPQQEIPKKVRPGRLQVFLANLFRMRFEEGPKVTYRTHWFILFVKIFIPTVFLVGIFSAVILRAVNIITFLPPVPFLVLALVLELVVFLVWIYEYMDWRNDYYEMTSEQVVDVYKKPLGTEERQAAPLKNIQSIEFKRKGILGLIFNYGTVYIRVGDAELTFDNVFNPAEVQRDLFHRIAERDYYEKQEALAEEKERLGDWIEAYHQFIRGQEKDQSPPTTG